MRSFTLISLAYYHRGLTSRQEEMLKLVALNHQNLTNKKPIKL
jgi:hypothetical protein